MKLKNQIKYQKGAVFVGFIIGFIVFISGIFAGYIMWVPDEYDIFNDNRMGVSKITNSSRNSYEVDQETTNIDFGVQDNTEFSLFKGCADGWEFFENSVFGMGTTYVCENDEYGSYAYNSGFNINNKEEAFDFATKGQTEGSVSFGEAGEAEGNTTVGLNEISINNGVVYTYTKSINGSTLIGDFSDYRTRYFIYSCENGFGTSVLYTHNVAGQIPAEIDDTVMSSYSCQ